jgi:hypothetical protein
MKYLFWILAKDKTKAVQSIVKYFNGNLDDDEIFGENKSSELDVDSEKEMEQKLGINVAGNANDLVRLVTLLRDKPEFKTAFGNVQLESKEFKVKSWIKILLEFNKTSNQGNWYYDIKKKNPQHRKEKLKTKM